MSITGDIDFFTTQPIESSEHLEAVLALLRYTPTPLIKVHMYEHEQMRMNVVRDLLRTELQEPEPEIIDLSHPADALPLVKNGKTVFFLVRADECGMRFAQTLEQAIPESVRDHFFPCDISLTIGPHDIYDTTEHEDWHLFGHSNFTVSFGGYGCPHDWNRYRELVFDLPIVKKLKADIEAIVGPLQQCASWSY